MMEKRMERQCRCLVNIAYYLVVMGIVLVLVRYALPFLWPFLVGFAIAFLLQPLCRWLSRKTGLGKKFCGALVIAVAYGVLLGLLWFLGARLLSAAQSIFSQLVDTFDLYVRPILERINRWTVESIALVSPTLAPEAGNWMDGVLEGLTSAIAQLSGSAVSCIANVGVKIPGFLASLSFAVMSSIFISMDYDRVARFLVRQFPKRFQPVILEAKRYSSGTILQYLRAYLILMGITFVELSVGFAVIGIANPIGVSAIISLCDALPVLGTGGIVIPWILIELLKGNYSLVIGLTVVYIIVTVVRSLIEPKVIGKQLGLHPLVTLLSIYVGMKVAGIGGMILFPMAMQVISSLHRSGSLRLWKE